VSICRSVINEVMTTKKSGSTNAAVKAIATLWFATVIRNAFRRASAVRRRVRGTAAAKVASLTGTRLGRTPSGSTT
jgi:hypothetical protein